MKQGVIIITIFIASILNSFGQNLKNSRPNIILVMTDDQGSHLSYTGHPYIQTPHIDKFAKKSLRLTEFHVSPTCAPTRAAILSGRHEFRNGVTHTIHERELMALSTTTFPELLKKEGYETGIFGKWHLGDIKEYRPSQRGFTEALTHGAGGIGQLFSGSCADFPPNNKSKNKYFDNVLLHNETVVQTKGYCTDLFFDASLSFIKKNIDAKKPFFSYIATNTPHVPTIAPKEYTQRIKNRYPGLETVIAKHQTINKEQLIQFYGMVENIDANFGKMMQKLEEWGALENTLVIFTTDNGASAVSGMPIFNANYKTGKGSTREGGTHVPCFWYWKGKLKENTNFKGLTAHIDLYKTFCDLAGVNIPSKIQKIEGRSLVPILENTDVKWNDRALFHTSGRWGVGEKPNRDKKWSVRTQKWRLINDQELYNIEKDPFEERNVISENKKIVNTLTSKYYQWWEETLPLMVNEKRTWSKEPPLHTLYFKQKKAKGIPFWEPTIK